MIRKFVAALRRFDEDTLELTADDAGPSLKWARAQVAKNTPQASQTAPQAPQAPQGGYGYQQTPQAPQGDWRTAQATLGQNDTPPF